MIKGDDVLKKKKIKGDELDEIFYKILYYSANNFENILNYGLNFQQFLLQISGVYNQSNFQQFLCGS